MFLQGGLFYFIGNKASDIKYKCSCGFKGHRDIVGALNIISVTVIDGKSLSA
ncbi:MAG: transposase, OrfB family [Firmicutes bacterium]|nr:transposase, OrfB family [Bacillota bacterium]